MVTLPGFKSVISAMLFSSDGTKLIAGDDNGTLRIHDIATGTATELALAKVAP